VAVEGSDKGSLDAGDKAPYISSESSIDEDPLRTSSESSDAAGVEKLARDLSALIEGLGQCKNS
jgi:hypothetical protein